MGRFFAADDLETPATLEQAAEVFTGEKFSGIILKLPEEPAWLKERCGAKIEQVIEP